MCTASNIEERFRSFPKDVYGDC